MSRCGAVRVYCIVLALGLWGGTAFGQDASISGYVEELGVPRPIGDILVSAWRWTGTEWAVEDDTRTGTNGTYIITGLTAGTYRVQFTSDSGNHVEEWYNNATNLTTATDIVLGSTDAATNINAIMEFVAGPFASVFNIFSAYDFPQQISDAEFASGNYLIVMHFEDLHGVVTDNTNHPYFLPRFSVFTMEEEPIYTNQEFASYTHVGATTVVASNDAQQAAAYDDIHLGFYKIRWSAVNSNGVRTVDSDATTGSYYIDFEGEGEVKDHFAGEVVNLSGTDWFLNNSLIGETSFDRKEGQRSLRIRREGEGIAGVMDMMADRLNGIRHISLLYAAYGNNPNPPHIAFQVSTNSGVDWFSVGETINPQGVVELQPFIVDVRVEGTVRVRIIVTGAGNQGHRTNVDNIRIVDFPGANEAQFVVFDDDITPPVAPSNIVEAVTGWTNVNAFALSWDEAYDPPDSRTDTTSGIYEYRIAAGHFPSAMDSFDYGLGTGLNGRNGGTGWNGAWQATADFSLSEDAPLEYGAVLGVDETGGRYTTGGSDGAAAGRYLDVTGTFAHLETSHMGIPHIGAADTSLWMSFLLRRDQTSSSTNAVCVSLHRHAANANDAADEILRVGDLGGDNRYWGLSAMGQSAWSEEPVVSFGQAFVAVQLEFTAGGNVARLYLNPPLDGNVPSEPDVVLTNAASDFLFNRVRIDPGPVTNGLSVDEIRFGSEYEQVSPGVAGASVGLVTQTVFSSARLGVQTNRLFAVDDDDDRPNDRLRGPPVQFETRFDNVPPLRMQGVWADLGADPMADISISWLALEDGGGIPGDSLSPWSSYVVYYTDEGRQPTTNDSFVAAESGVAALGEITTTNVMIEGFEDGTTYRLAVAGRDMAGNIGPLSTDQVVVALAGLNLTQGVGRANYRAELYWSIAEGREYDLISADGPNWSASLTSSWLLVASGITNMLIDTNTIAGSHLRFYRAARAGRWTTNHIPRAASEEVYVGRMVRLYPGQNWVAMPGIPDTNTVQYVLRHYLPAGSAPADSTRINWYDRHTGEQVARQIWLSQGQPNVWIYSYPEAMAGQVADSADIPIEDGFVIELAGNSPPLNFVFVGRLPTNSMAQTILGGRRFNLINTRYPMHLHPSQMNLVESGFTGGTTFRRSDRLWKLRRDTQSVEEILWFNTSDGTWRRRTAQGDLLVPAGYFMPDDAIVLYTIQSASDWTWELAPPYPLPTRFINP